MDDKLTVPPTEAEVSTVLDTMQKAGMSPEARAVFRRLAFERDRLRGERDALLAAAPTMRDVCVLLDAIDCCTGYSIPDADWPKFWEALELARKVLTASA